MTAEQYGREIAERLQNHRGLSGWQTETAARIAADVVEEALTDCQKLAFDAGNEHDTDGFTCRYVADQILQMRRGRLGTPA